MARFDAGTNLLRDGGLEQGQVLLSLPNSQFRVSAFLQGEFSIAAGNNFNQPLASSALDNISQKVNVAKSVVDTAANFSGRNFNTGAQVSIKPLNTTALTWIGSEKPKFSIDLLFLATRRGEDIRDPIKELYRGVFPTVTGGGVLGSAILKAPYGFRQTQGGLSAKGTVGVQLGRWFRATRQIITNVSFTFSQEMVPLDGTPRSRTGATSDAGPTVDPTKFAPLFARGSISFEPFRDITYNEFTGYFNV